MFDPDLADIRFGCGLSPRIVSPRDVDEILEGLAGRDTMALMHPIPGFHSFAERIREYYDLNRERDRLADQPEVAVILERMREINLQAHRDQRGWIADRIARRVQSRTPMRERLEAFWADHFTTYGKGGPMVAVPTPYVQSAIRPNMTGSFEDLLRAAVTHPVMLQTLDQQSSAGPQSRIAEISGGKRGLNENLARELLELHTLGVDGPYSQGDVRELARLLAGLSYDADRRMVFRNALAEPGRKTILGRSYGGAELGTLEDIHAALHDLAVHPGTAHYVSHKLAVHFVSDTPDPELVRSMARAWQQSSGALMQVYEAMLRHPAAWKPEPGNIKPPFDFIASACRALDPSDLDLKDFRIGAQLLVQGPLRLMGMAWERPSGPDGWPEADSAWITPQGMAARLQWAFAVPQSLVTDLPDPRTFVEIALGSRVTKDLRFAAGAAETRADGIGVILASPAFQRM